jgi:hypothetical protein
MAMLTREDIGDLLQMHAKAYRLLMWLDREALRQPTMLAPGVVVSLARPASCRSWLATNRSTLPAGDLPEGQLPDEFVNLFSSSRYRRKRDVGCGQSRVDDADARPPSLWWTESL